MTLGQEMPVIGNWFKLLFVENNGMAVRFYVSKDSVTYRTANEDGIIYITYNAPMTIQPGDMEGIAETDWIGPLVGEIPLQLQGKMNDEKLFATIYIDMMSTLGQIIKVQLGTDDFSKAGDLNGDGKVDIADAVSILNLMAAGTYMKAADLNNDEKVDIADFVSTLNIMAGN